MTLTEAFAGHLAEPSQARALADALASAGFALEAALLGAYAERGAHAGTLGHEGGPWAGRRVHVGPVLPAAVVGELWFDPCEVATMLVVPDIPEEETRSLAPSARAQWRPEQAFISLRPVTRWQMGGFLRMARTRARATRETLLVTPLDAPRLLADDEAAPVVHASLAEAALYWTWFGKGGANEDTWQAARRLLGEDGVAALWGHPGREWAGGLADLDAFVALTPGAIDMDYRDEYDREEEGPAPAGQRRFFGPWEAPGDVAFRTAVSVRDGLRTAPASTGAIELLDLLARERWPR